MLYLCTDIAATPRVWRKWRRVGGRPWVIRVGGIRVNMQHCLTDCNGRHRHLRAVARWRSADFPGSGATGGVKRGGPLAFVGGAWCASTRGTKKIINSPQQPSAAGRRLYCVIVISCHECLFHTPAGFCKICQVIGSTFRPSIIAYSQGHQGGIHDPEALSWGVIPSGLSYMNYEFVRFFSPKKWIEF